MNEKKPISVKQLNLYLKSLLESDFRLADILVRGEISNFKNHYSSGHLYFSLKDCESAVRCVMFKSNAQKLLFSPCDGQEVVIRGRVSVYEKDGQYMLYASEMHEAGLGDAALAFAEIKEKLSKEGLFDEENKRPLPAFPKRIAVITSDTGAAVNDITNILNMRYPVCDIILCPALVQGVNAANSMIKSLERVYKLSSVDLIIIGRGGGSNEDLAPFNDEALARKIYESPIPVISAVGHEIDYTICDFVADKRASTPSHAAEIAVPDIAELQGKVDMLLSSIKSSVKNKFLIENNKFDSLKSSFNIKKYETYIEEKAQDYDSVYDLFLERFNNLFQKKQERFFSVISSIDALSPFKTVAKGFAVVKKDGKNVRNISDIKRGDKIRVGFYDGFCDCEVNDTAPIHRLRDTFNY